MSCGWMRDDAFYDDLLDSLLGSGDHHLRVPWPRQVKPIRRAKPSRLAQSFLRSGRGEVPALVRHINRSFSVRSMAASAAWTPPHPPTLHCPPERSTTPWTPHTPTLRSGREQWSEVDKAIRRRARHVGEDPFCGLDKKTLVHVMRTGELSLLPPGLVKAFVCLGL
jgi:hypothetical protein